MAEHAEEAAPERFAPIPMMSREVSTLRRRHAETLPGGESACLGAPQREGGTKHQPARSAQRDHVGIAQMHLRQPLTVVPRLIEQCLEARTAPREQHRTR